MISNMKDVMVIVVAPPNLMRTTLRNLQRNGAGGEENKSGISGRTDGRRWGKRWWTYSMV
jgi:hypothetical protein